MTSVLKILDAFVAGRPMPCSFSVETEEDRRALDQHWLACESWDWERGEAPCAS